MSKLAILIVEDEPVIAENISIYLDNNDFEVSGIAYDSEDALQQLQQQTPDAVILDINLESEQDGIDIARHINEHYQLPFLFLTSYSDKHTLERAKQVQPAGYIVKPFNERTLLASLEIAISNHAMDMNKGLPALSLDKINRGLLSPLSQREFEILQLLYGGVTNNQMAAQLFISVNTIKTHLKNIYLKLDVNSRLEVMNKLRKG
jgi:DNA-binding NarL/FixJ family response regulator